MHEGDKDILPPKWVLHFLKWFCPSHLIEEIEGDLIQRFERDLRAQASGASEESRRLARAKRRLFWNVIKFFRPGIIMQNKFRKTQNSNYLIRDHFKVAIRHILKSKTYSLINITGLVVGISAFFLMVQYLAFELSFDRFHENGDRIYRVTYEQVKNNEVTKSAAGTFFGVGNTLRDNFEEVEEVVRFYKWPANTGAVLMAEEKVFNERNYFFAEPSFFMVFPTLLTMGDMKTCLEKPNSIVLSQRLATKMFGVEPAIGKLVKRLDMKDTWLTVTGIMQDTPANSHFDVDVVIPYDKDWLPDKEGTWRFPDNWTYILLKPGSDARAIAERLNIALQKEHSDSPEFKGARTILQPLHDVHFSAYKTWELKANGSKKIVWGIGAAAIIILLIAWINYFNLEISRFLNRTREVGVRKVIGSTRGQLIGQFFVQYTCLVVAALIFSLVLIIWVRPFYHSLTGADFLLFSKTVKWPWLVAAGFFLIGSLVTGVYPAFSLARLNPITCIKGKITSSRVSGVKRTLLTFQLVASLVLLSFLFVVFSQLNFMRGANKSMELDHVLIVYNTTSYSIHEDTLKKEHSLAFRNKVLQNPIFQNVSASSVVPGDPVGFTYHNLTKRALSDADDNVPYKVVFVDYHFIPVYHLPLKAGRNYSTDNGEDNSLNSVVLNESAVKTLGFGSAEEALNQEIYFMVTWDWKKYKIIGVVEDYRHESVKVPVYPTVFYLHNYVGQMTYYSLLIDRHADPKVAVATAEKIWKEIWPEKPFDYFFSDQHYDQQFKSEIYLGRIFAFFAGVAVFLACLGVLGMTLFEANSRLREISIRKVLGASVGNLIAMLNRVNVGLLALSSVISFPVAYYFISQWLSTYPVKIEFSFLYLLLPFAGLFFLVAFTSVVQTWRAAQSNPVNYLKDE